MGVFWSCTWLRQGRHRRPVASRPNLSSEIWLIERAARSSRSYVRNENSKLVPCQLLVRYGTLSAIFYLFSFILLGTRAIVILFSKIGSTVNLYLWNNNKLEILRGVECYSDSEIGILMQNVCEELITIGKASTPKPEIKTCLTVFTYQHVHLSFVLHGHGVRVKSMRTKYVIRASSSQTPWNIV